MALSSKGFEGLGPVFRVQNAAQSEQEAPQAQPGKVRNSPRFSIQCMHSTLVDDKEPSQPLHPRC